MFYVFFDHFSKYVPIVPAAKDDAYHFSNSIFDDWISNFGSPQYLATDRRAEHLNADLANFYTMFDIQHSPKASDAP